jgi:site-specific recombinase XerC
MATPERAAINPGLGSTDRPSSRELGCEVMRAAFQSRNTRGRSETVCLHRQELASISWQVACPDRNPQFRAELERFLKQLRDERGYTDQTLSTRESALTLFFEWLGKQSIPLKEVSPQTLAAYFVENKTRGWKKATIKVYAQSLRVFFRYAEQHNWCAPGLAKTIESPRIYSMSGLPEGPSWEQVRRLIASLNSDRPGHIRDRAIILLLAVYGLRIGEVCALTLDDLDWTNEKIRVRRPKNTKIQDFPPTAEILSRLSRLFFSL